LKNRKSARKSRKRRKVELSTLRDEIRALKQENQRLRQQVGSQPSSGLNGGGHKQSEKVRKSSAAKGAEAASASSVMS
jgi:dynactin complex subunit